MNNPSVQPKASLLAETFMQTLQHIEATGDVTSMVALFAENAELQRMTSKHTEKGSIGARIFWQVYLDNFREIHSSFSNIVETGNTLVLEWVSQGTLNDGSALHYRGMSILEREGNKFKGFRTYYDSAAFVSGETVKGG